MVLKVRGDNIGALTLVLKMRPANLTIGIVAREFALRLVELSIQPDVAHTPDVAHVFADRLSKVFAPNGTGIIEKSMHPALVSAQLTEVPVRHTSWYRAQLIDLPPADGI